MNTNKQIESLEVDEDSINFTFSNTVLNTLNAHD